VAKIFELGKRRNFPLGSFDDDSTAVTLCRVREERPALGGQGRRDRVPPVAVLRGNQMWSIEPFIDDSYCSCALSGRSRWWGRKKGMTT
jgi:hypothetical protein